MAQEKGLKKFIFNYMILKTILLMSISEYLNGILTIYLFSQVQRTVNALKKSNISVGGGVKSSTFVRVKHEDASEGKIDK